MAFYSRRGNWGWNPYKKYRYGGKRTKGNMKAAKQTRDSLQVTVKCNHAFVASYSVVNDYGVAVLPIYEILKKSPQFLSFMNLYDQVKVNGIRTKLNVVDADVSLKNIGQIKSVNVITGWDRTGVSKDQVIFTSDFGDASTNPQTPPTIIPRDKWDEIIAKGFYYRIGKGIVNATGVSKTTLNAFQRWSASPYLYPSTQEEKSCYLPTSNFDDFTGAYNSATHLYAFAPNYDGLKPLNFFTESNPCMPFESLNCKWKPTLYVGVFNSSLNTTTNTVDQYSECPNVLFNAEFSIDVTFRNLKAAT